MLKKLEKLEVGMKMLKKLKKTFFNTDQKREKWGHFTHKKYPKNEDIVKNFFFMSN